MDGNYTLQTVERAFAFLEAVAASPAPLSTRDVAEKLGLNITTCYHILRTLVGLGYIEKREDGRLEIGAGVMRLYRGYRPEADPEKELSQLVEALSRSTYETAFLSLRDGDGVILKELVEGMRRLRVGGLHVGLKGGEHRRASGKAVLAHLGADEQAAMLDASLLGRPPSRRQAVLERLETELAEIVERGYALDEETEEGIVAIAAPVFSGDAGVLGAVGIVLPKFRFDGAPGRYQEAVLAAAERANHLLRGGSPNRAG